MNHTLELEIRSSRVDKVINRLLKVIEKDPTLKLRRKGKKISIVDNEEMDEDNMMLPGPPMTWEQLRKELQESERQIKNGQVYTTEELLQDMKKW